MADARIPLASIRPRIMSPMQGLEVEQFAGEVQDEQQQRQSLAQLKQIYAQPDAFEPSGAVTPQTVQRISSVNPVMGRQIAQERHLTLQELARSNEQQAMSDLRRAQAKKIQTEDQVKQNKLKSDELSSILTSAMAVHDTTNGSPDDKKRAFNEALLKEFDLRDKSGKLKASFFNDTEIEQARANLPTPEEAKQILLTSKQKEIMTREQGAGRTSRRGGEDKVGVPTAPPSGWEFVKTGGGNIIPTGGNVAGLQWDTISSRMIPPDKLDEVMKKTKLPSGYMWDPKFPGTAMRIPGLDTESYASDMVGDAHGDEFLKSLPRQQAKDVKNFSEGRIPLSAIAKKEQKSFLEDVLQYKPDYRPGRPGAVGAGTGGAEQLTPEGMKVAEEFIKAGKPLPGGYSKAGITRGNRILNDLGKQESGGPGSGSIIEQQQRTISKQGVLKDFTSGKSANNVTAINTAIGHIGSLDQLGTALNNRDTKVINAVVNRIATETGNPNVNNFDTAKSAVGNELMRVFRQVGASEQETKDWEAKFSSASSPAQIKGALRVASELLQSRIDALNDQWKRGMQTDKPFPDLVSPKSMKVLKSLGGETPKRETPSAKMPPVGPYSDPEKEKRYQLWKQQNGQ